MWLRSGLLHTAVQPADEVAADVGPHSLRSAPAYLMGVGGRAVICTFLEGGGLEWMGVIMHSCCLEWMGVIKHSCCLEWIAVIKHSCGNRKGSLAMHARDE